MTKFVVKLGHAEMFCDSVDEAFRKYLVKPRRYNEPPQEKNVFVRNELGDYGPVLRPGGNP